MEKEEKTFEQGLHLNEIRGWSEEELRENEFYPDIKKELCQFFIDAGISIDIQEEYFRGKLIRFMSHEAVEHHVQQLLSSNSDGKH